MSRWLVWIGCLLLGCALHGLASVHPLLNIPLDDPMMSEVYTFVDRVALKYQFKGLLKNRRPYSQGQMAAILEQLRNGNFPLTSIERQQMEHLAELFSEEYRPLLRAKGEDYQFGLNFEPGLITTRRTEPAQPAGTEYAWQFRPIVSGGVRDDFALSTDLRWYVVPGDKLEDTIRIETEVNAGFTSGGFAPAYARLSFPWFDLSLGKTTISWGPGRRGNLMLSPNALPLDMVEFQAQYGLIGFQAFTGFAKGIHGDKTLSAHRLDFNLWDRGSLGITESIMIDEGDFEPVLLNPFSIYAVAEPTTSGELDGRQRESLGNTLISGDMELWVLPNTSLYGELMLDDLQTRLGWRSWRNWGTKFGIQFGLNVVDPLSISNSGLRAEYTFVNQYAYTHWRPVSEYTHSGKVLGHEIGTDADDLWVEFHVWLAADVLGKLAYERERHGEGDVTKARALDAPYDVNWEFLSGIVETTNHFSVECQYHRIGEFLLKGKYTLSHIADRGHVEGASGNQHEIMVNGSYRF